jgi:8-oxo-dGTP pyrophosphatase MutT (NUDIX family)
MNKNFSPEMSLKTYHITIQDIEEALKLDLPGEKIHQRMLPSGRSLALPTEKSLKIKESAVLVLLFLKNKELHFCLTRRNQNMKYHPGQISFPGGSREEYEMNIFETALRELEEETGVDKTKVKVIGKLSDLYISVSNFLIHPVVGFLDHEPEFRIAPIEVDEMIVVTLKSIFKKNNKTSTKIETLQGELNVPCYKINDLIIWGATAMIIEEFIELLRIYFHPKAKYSDNDDNVQGQSKQN